MRSNYVNTALDRTVKLGAAIAAALLLGAFAWHYFSSAQMTPYSLVDPDVLLSALPNPPLRDKSETNDPKYFDTFGYLRGEPGTGIAMAFWSKRPFSTDDPYDIDLVIRITATPSPEIASKGLVLEAKEDEALLKDTKAVELPITLRADQHVAKLLEHARLPSSYVISARYGNYLFRFVARLAPGGYFETEQQMVQTIQMVDAHIVSTLRRAAEHGP